MKIGILTFHDAHNYGAMLQCYALQQYLTSQGYEVTIINYCPSFYQKQYKKHHILPFLGKNPIRTLRSLYYNVYLYNKRCNAFIKFHKKYLHLSSWVSFKDIPPTYDAYIVGSDQIWNPNLTNGFDKVYFCDFNFPKEKRKYISYAPSMEKQIFTENEIKFLTHAFGRFDALSVRESSLIPSLQPLTPKKIHQVLDPTLLIDPKIWIKLTTKTRKPKSPYVLLYQIRENKLVREKAYQLAKRIHGHVVELTARIDYHYPTKAQTASPLDFINYFYYADYVLTTSFHGTAFSLIFERNFYTFKLNDNFDNRSHSLLKEVKLENRYITPNDIINLTPINYSETNKRLNFLREKSREFLKNALM